MGRRRAYMPTFAAAAAPPRRRRRAAIVPRAHRGSQFPKKQSPHRLSGSVYVRSRRIIVESKYGESFRCDCRRYRGRGLEEIRYVLSVCLSSVICFLNK